MQETARPTGLFNFVYQLDNPTIPFVSSMRRIEVVPVGRMVLPAGSTIIPSGFVSIPVGMEAIPAGKMATQPYIRPKFRF